MTMYTEDVNYRMRTVFFILGVLSAILALALHSAVRTYPSMIAPATLVFFGILFWLFDAILWKLPLIRLLNSGIPNIAGDWEGNVVRSEGPLEQKVAIKLRIRQTWSKLDLRLTSPESVSKNVLAGLRLADPNAILLTWIYHKRDKDPHSLLDSGRGMIEVTLHRKSGEDSLKGATLSGRFIQSQPGEPLEVEFKKAGPFYWNPEPF